MTGLSVTGLSAAVLPLRADDGRPRLRVSGHAPTAPVVVAPPRAPLGARCAARLARSRAWAAEALPVLRARLRAMFLPSPRPLALPIGAEGRDRCGLPSAESFPVPLPGRGSAGEGLIGESLGGASGIRGAGLLDLGEPDGTSARIAWSEQIALAAGLAALLAILLFLS